MLQHEEDARTARISALDSCDRFDIPTVGGAAARARTTVARSHVAERRHQRHADRNPTTGDKMNESETTAASTQEACSLHEVDIPPGWVPKDGERICENCEPPVRLVMTFEVDYKEFKCPKCGGYEEFFGRRYIDPS